MPIKQAWVGRFLAALLLAIFAASPADAQDRRIISGTVTDSSGRFIAYVTLDGGVKFRTVTNAVGEFSVSVPAKDRFDVNVRRIGFLPTKLQIEPGADTTVRVSMQQLAVLMTTQVVRAQQTVRTLELRGMYERMLESQKGALVADFILPEEIEIRNPQRVSQLLEARRGIHVRRMGSCNVIAQCYYVFGTNGCPATVFLDGQRLNRLAAASNDIGATPAVDELIPVSSVAGVEVYPRGALAPAKYQALGGTCAIVLIWTR
jgi:hypothetical protein